MSSFYVAILSLIISCTAACISGYQAFITRDQLSIVKDQEVRQLRSYVGSSSMQLLKSTGGDHLYLSLSFHNFGATPGYKFNFNWHVDTEVKNARNEYVTSSSDSDVDQGSTFFPQSDQVWNIDFIVGQFPDEFDADRRIVTLYGTLFYHDAFENPRKAQFCYIIKHDNVLALSKPNAVVFPDRCNSFLDSN